jgi:hypothetical protein
MLMIGFGAGLITFGFVGAALSNYMEVNRREDWVLMFQRAGASVANFSLNLSSGRYMLGVSVWIHNYAEGFYSISDVNGSEVVIVPLANTDQSSEWKYNEVYFELIDSGYYSFKLLNATFSSVRSIAELFQRIYVNEFLYPYRSFFWIGVFSLVVGVPLVVVGTATSLLPNSKD